jgi:hypothetical protein
MSRPIHLVTVVGGIGVDMLPHLLRHYQELGIRSCFVIAHVPEPDEVFVARVAALAASCGVAIDSVEVGQDFPACKDRAFARVMTARPHDWFLPIDHDEFHVYPQGLAALIDRCERQGYDYVRGCFVDRVSDNGVLAPLDPIAPIWTQYPLGGMLTWALLGGDPRKIVIAKGHVAFVSCGHHDAWTGVGCPPDEILIQVHHFKWVGAMLPYLRNRRDLFRRLGNPYWVESDRALSYFDRYERIDVRDDRLLIAPCDPDYAAWDRVRAIVRAMMLEDEARRALPAPTACLGADPV